MTDLPRGWVEVRTDEAGSLDLGRQRSPKYHDGQNMKPYLRVANVFEDRIDSSDLKTMHFEPEAFERSKLHAGDVLLNEGQSPELLGRPAIYSGDPPDVAFTNSLIRFRPSRAVTSEWALTVFRHHMHSGRFARESRITTNIAHLSLNRLATVEFPIPPRSEQERIVAVIEEAFSKLDAGEAGMRAVRQLIKRMREAILTAAINGRLVARDPTEAHASELLDELGVDRVEGAGAPPGWASVRLGAIARVGSGTTPKRGRPDYWLDGSIPWVTSGLLSAGVVTSAAEFVTELALHETSLRLWPPGTLLVAMYGEGQTRGRCAELAIEATCNQACAAVDLNPRLAEYRRLLRLHFDANYAANRRLAAGGVQPNLSGALIKDMVIALPPGAEAARMVAEVERQISFLDACEGAAKAGLGRTTALRRSILKSAFEGKLVPQDPCDEPASGLLDRIRAELAATPRKRRARAKA